MRQIVAVLSAINRWVAGVGIAALSRYYGGAGSTLNRENWATDEVVGRWARDNASRCAIRHPDQLELQLAALAQVALTFYRERLANPSADGGVRPGTTKPSAVTADIRALFPAGQVVRVRKPGSAKRPP